MEARRGEIEDAALSRIYAIADPDDIADPRYKEGLRIAVSSGVEYGLCAVGTDDTRLPPVPTSILSQARLAARHDVALDTILRRYFAGYIVFVDFLVQEAGAGRVMREPELRQLLQSQASQFDRVVAAVSEEYARERADRVVSPEVRRLRRIRCLLEGEPLDTASFGYVFGGWHVGAIAVGPDATAVVGRAAESLGRPQLIARAEEESVWAWFGGGQPFDDADLNRIGAASAASGTLAVGEPAPGMAGWRLTHRQAVAALGVALRGGEQFVRYADVALLAPVLESDVHAASLRRLFLEPFEDVEKDGGAALRETLRAYFAADRNVSSTAAILKISRQAVARRLRVVEEKLGRSLAACGSELEVALRLDEMAIRADKV